MPVVFMFDIKIGCYKMGSIPAVAFSVERQYSQKKGTLTKFALLEFAVMIYDEKTDVWGVISNFLVVDCYAFEPRTLPGIFFSQIWTSPNPEAYSAHIWACRLSF